MKYFRCKKPDPLTRYGLLDATSEFLELNAFNWCVTFEDVQSAAPVLLVIFVIIQ